MLTSALKPARIRFLAAFVTIFLLAGVAFAQAAATKKKKKAKNTAEVSAPASTPAKPELQAEPSQPAAASPVLIKEWGPYLDVAYELSYWDKTEIRDWREKREQEIGETLQSYIADWKAKLSSPAAGTSAVAGLEVSRRQIYRERDYLRLVIALTVDYLQSENRNSLNDAALFLDTLKEKGSMPEITFWISFVKALQALEDNDAPRFVDHIYGLWNDSVLYIEQGAAANGASNTAAGTGASYLYRNVVNLVVNRAIIDRKLADVNALGPLFLMLKERDLEEKPGEGQYMTTLVKRIADGLVAPDSDRFRLSYTVAAIEAKRLQQIAAAKLDAEGMSGESRKAFEQARLFIHYALECAASSRSSGAVAEVVDYLDISSFAIQRLAGNEKGEAYPYFAMLPAYDGASTLTTAMAVFNDVAAFGDKGRELAGYANRDLYLKATHRLWRAIMELSLWTGDFYLSKLNDLTDPQSIFTQAAPMQVVLDSYLDFLAAQKSRGFPDVIPDSAYFGAAEAAEKLAFTYQKTYSFSTDSTAYNLWFLHRLQSVEIFPFDPREIAQSATVLKRDGRYNLFLDYFVPLAERFKASTAVKGWLEAHNTETGRPVRDYLNSIDEIFAPALNRSDAGSQGTSGDPLAASFRKLREELQREPDHPVHKLIKAFYVEEIQKTTPYTLLLKDAQRLNQ
jgi:hypothetical protein